MSDEKSIKINAGGPYEVSGGIPLYEDALVMSENGTHQEYHRVREYDVDDTYHLCRCGHSSKKPFCDGSHRRVGFEGTEVASREPYLDRVQEYPGYGVNLLDDDRCAYARFCHRAGADVWTLTEESGQSEEVKEQAVLAAWHCPTGRLESHDAKTGKVYEQEFDPSIVILEDTEEGVSGPYFVRGGVSLVGADGIEYEERNRYALCRCGNSRNIPFCDAMHVSIGFNDGTDALQGNTGDRDDSFDETCPLD